MTHPHPTPPQAAGEARAAPQGRIASYLAQLDARLKTLAGDEACSAFIEGRAAEWERQTARYASEWQDCRQGGIDNYMDALATWNEVDARLRKARADLSRRGGEAAKTEHAP